MMNRLYAISIGDILFLAFSVVADLDPYLRTGGLIVGIVVGIVTAMRMWQDFKVRRIEAKLKEIELKEKQK